MIMYMGGREMENNDDDDDDREDNCVENSSTQLGCLKDVWIVLKF